jgi:hypothetical protein
VHGTQAGWATPGTLAALLAGAGLIAALAGWERITPEPMIPPALLRNPKFSAASATQFLMSSAIFSAAFMTSQFFQAGQGALTAGRGPAVPAVDGDSRCWSRRPRGPSSTGPGPGGWSSPG